MLERIDAVVAPTDCEVRELQADGPKKLSKLQRALLATFANGVVLLRVDLPFTRNVTWLPNWQHRNDWCREYFGKDTYTARSATQRALTRLLQRGLIARRGYGIKLYGLPDPVNKAVEHINTCWPGFALDGPVRAEPSPEQAHEDDGEHDDHEDRRAAWTEFRKRWGATFAYRSEDGPFVWFVWHLGTEEHGDPWWFMPRDDDDDENIDGPQALRDPSPAEKQY
jgi:hypothetical protein